MKNTKLLLFVLFILVFAVNNQAQTLFNGIGHIPSNYQVPWHEAGLINEPTSFSTVRVYVISGGTGDDYHEFYTQQQAAKTWVDVDAVNRLAIIHFLEGTYFLDSTITINANYQNLVIQGAGSDRTTLVFQNITNFPCISIYGYYGDWIDVNGALNKGDKRLYPDPMVPGTWTDKDWIQFIVENYDYRYDGDPQYFASEIVGQISKIETVDGSGNWIEIVDEANQYYYDLDGEDRPLIIRKLSPAQNIGIENLKIIRDPVESAWGSARPYQIIFNGAINCWVRGVEIYKPSCNHLALVRSTHCEVSGCYFHEAGGYGGGGWGYGVVMDASTTNCLVENNIFRSLRHSLVAGGGSNCNVWTFNYSREQCGTDTDRDLDLHAKWPCGHLFEYNIVEEIGADNHHGANGFYNTFLRNYCYDKATIRLKEMENWSFLGNISNMYSAKKALCYYADHGPIVDLFGYKDSYTIWVTHQTNRDSGFVCELRDTSYYYSSRPDFLPDTWQ